MIGWAFQWVRRFSSETSSSGRPGRAINKHPSGAPTHPKHRILSSCCRKPAPKKTKTWPRTRNRCANSQLSRRTITLILALADGRVETSSPCPRRSSRRLPRMCVARNSLRAILNPNTRGRARKARGLGLSGALLTLVQQAGLRANTRNDGNVHTRAHGIVE